ncbi:5'/3'-nucleotidase SurE [Hasllibacter halocynthiae]|nr:5'/3'-nucleotidase SurE [Hasllibacter halocynthiae]
MRILVTNDDGINAPGLKIAEAIAGALAGDGGEVWTVAPAFEQSGVGHCISYTHPTLISEFGPRRWAAEGSPADCVLAAVHEIMPAAPDLVLSGVNRGNNAAQNAMYSGTVGACIEGEMQGIRSIALSQFLGPRTQDLADPFEAAAAWGERAVRAILDHDDWGDLVHYGIFYNVNFPPCPAAEVAGLRAAAQGHRGIVPFGATAQQAPTGRRFVWVRGERQDRRSEDGSDVAANLDGYVSITPMRCDLTAHDRLGALSAALA